METLKTFMATRNRSTHIPATDMDRVEQHILIYVKHLTNTPSFIAIYGPKVSIYGQSVQLWWRLWQPCSMSAQQCLGISEDVAPGSFHICAVKWFLDDIGLDIISHFLPKLRCARLCKRHKWFSPINEKTLVYINGGPVYINIKRARWCQWL